MLPDLQTNIQHILIVNIFFGIAASEDVAYVLSNWFKYYFQGAHGILVTNFSSYYGIKEV